MLSNLLVLNLHNMQLKMLGIITLPKFIHNDFLSIFT
jgi:hypothetical protein